MNALPIHPTERDRERFRDAAKQNMTWCDFNRTGVDGDYKDPETRNLFKMWWSVERERQLLHNLNQSQGSKLSEWARRYETLAAEVERLGGIERAIAKKLQDPASVYTAMLRGEIAKLTWRQMVHLSGPVPNTADEALAEITRLRAEVERLNLIISRLSVEGQDAVEM